MMKRVLSLVAVLAVFIPNVCFGAWVYPEYTGANKNETEVTERINIIFDNSGHKYVKEMLRNIMISAAVAEKTDIWIYPIAGSNEPVKVEPTQEFIEANYNAYTKSSNEFKAENIVEKAFNDLNNDTTVSTKRLILYADNSTDEIRSEYSLYDWQDAYIQTPGIIFAGVSSHGSMYDNINMYGVSNYEALSGKELHEYILIKNGYSACEAQYFADAGVIKFDKGKVNNNIVVIADDKDVVIYNYSEAVHDLYLGGCAMGSSAYEEYQKKGKVKGVALSYNHIVADHEDSGVTYAAALYTLDGTVADPVNDSIYIPLINAENVTVYHKETKGAGVCSAETEYNTKQDKEIVNIKKAPVKTESQSSPKEEVSYKDPFSIVQGEQTEKSIVSRIFSGIGNVLGIIIGLIFRLLKLGIFVFIVLLIVYRKFRSFILLKIVGSKFGPTYEKIMIKVKTFIREVSNSGVKIKGTTDLDGKYVFISKSSSDMILPENRIELVIKALESRGIKCWVSEKGIKPGQSYAKVLPEAIRKCSLFLVFLSPVSVQSEEVIAEVGVAREHKKTIIPVQIEPFDLFKEYTDWGYLIKQFQKTDLFASKPDEIKALADSIEQAFNEK